MAYIPRASTANQALPTARGSSGKHCRQVGATAVGAYIQVGIQGRWAAGRHHAGLLPVLCSPALPTLPSDPSTVKLENFPIHAITGVLKQWLRELPEPLMTFAQYSDFLRAVGESHGGGKGSGWSMSGS